MSAQWDVLGLGVVAVDDLLYVDAYPPPDTKVLVQAKRREGGGLTGTALVAAARLGARAAYCGVLGDDELSRFTLQALEGEGVDCTPVIRQPGARPYHATIIVDRSSGQRTIFASREGAIGPQAEDVTPELIARCRVLFLDYTTGQAGMRAIELARVRAIPTIGDVERMTEVDVETLLSRLDHLIVGTTLAAEVTGEQDPARMVRALGGPHRACCVVTAGEQGCWYAERDGPVRHFPAYRVQVVDTTGCGDVFHGAYAACIARGESVERAIQVATATAGIKATHRGGRSGIPTRAAVEEFLQET